MTSVPRVPQSPAGVSAVRAGWAVLILAAAAIAAGLAVAPYRSFDLDRFFVPKELVLHAAALLAALPLVVGRRRLTFGGVDVLFALFFTLSAASAVVATNHWLAARALALTWSGLLVFWSASAAAAGSARRGRVLVAALIVAVLAVIATALAQAYGIDSSYFSANRAPGGTLGNRNFVAHLGAVVTPLLIVAALGARRRLLALVSTLALAVVTAFLVLSRTRAAWLALAACVVVLLPGVWRARHRWNVVGLRRRILLNAAVVAAAVTAAVFAPNALDWRSKSPYLDTMKNVADYSGGSGRGRLLQYEHSLQLAVRHPVLGVGPGNWAVTYPAGVKANDPSLDSDDGMTANPWPSSDWMAYVSERGFAATVVLVLAWLLLLGDAGRQMLDAADFPSYLRGLALAGVVVASAIVGLFDAVLLLPAPALVVFAAFGALRTPPSRRTLAPGGGMRALLLGLVLVGGVVAAARSALMLDAMRNYERGATATAAREDPGSYRIAMRLATAAQARGRCDLVRVHAGAAAALYPHAPQPRHMLAACGGSATR